MSYLFCGEYVAENELALSVLDPALDLPLPGDLTPVLSARDQAAPTLAEALERGLLPHYDKCKAAEEALSH